MELKVSQMQLKILERSLNGQLSADQSSASSAAYVVPTAATNVNSLRKTKSQKSISWPIRV